VIVEVVEGLRDIRHHKSFFTTRLTDAIRQSPSEIQPVIIKNCPGRKRNKSKDRRVFRFEQLEQRSLFAGDGIWSEQRIESLSDLNGNNAIEIAIAQYDPVRNINELTVIDSLTRQVSLELNLPGTSRVVDVSFFRTSTGADRVAVLTEGRTSKVALLQIRDPRTGQRLQNFRMLSGASRPIDLEIYNNLQGRTQVAVLGYDSVTQRSRIQIIDLATQAKVSDFTVSTGWRPVGLELLSTPGQLPTLVVLETTGTTSVVSARLQSRSTTGTRIATRAIGTQLAENRISSDPDSSFVARGNQLLLLASTANGTGYSIRRFNSSLVAVDNVTFVDSKKALSFVVTGNDLTAVSRIDVLLRHPTSQATFTRSLVATAATWLRGPTSVVQHGNGFASTDLAILAMPGTTTPEQVLLQFSDLQQQSRLRFSSALTGQHHETVPIAMAPVTSVPQWYEENRVQLHTRVGAVHPNPETPAFFGTDEWLRASEGAAALGSKVLTRHFKARDEDPWWPSYLPDSGETSMYAADRVNAGISLTAGRNLAQEYLDEAYTNNVRMIAYYWLSSEASLGVSHPEWVCRTSAGAPISHPRRGTYLDLASDYAKVVTGRLLELASMGAEGFYFDSFHMPEEGCWGGSFEQAFVTATGLAVPTGATSPTYGAWIRFKADFLTSYFNDLTAAVNKQFPHVAMIISNVTAVGLFETQTTSTLAASGIGKTEFSFATRFDNKFYATHPTVYRPDDDYRNALGWTLLRDASNGAPPHVWMAGFPNPAHVRAFVSSLITYGAIANIDVPEANLLIANNPAGTSTRETVQAGVQLGNLLSSAVIGKTANTEVAILFSEAQRNARPTIASAYAEVIGPVIGAFEAFRRETYAVNLVNDSQLADAAFNLSRFKILFITNLSQLSPSQAVAVQAFVTSGGKVIENSSGWNWTQAAGYQAAKAALIAIAGTLAPPSLSTTGNNDHVHVQQFIDLRDPNKKTILISNDFRFVQSLRGSGGNEPINPAPAAISNLRITLRYTPGITQLTAPELQVSDWIGGQPIVAQRGIDGWVIDVPTFTEVAALKITVLPLTSAARSK